MSVRLNDEVTIDFQRTLRIPDDGCEYPLPPGLGSFAVEATAEGFVVPMHVQEAMWLSFDAPFHKPYALKVGIGGIDVLTGEPFDPGKLSDDPQDYLVIPDQPWLDGINAGDGFVRQFVAVRLGEGQSVEGRLTGYEERGGLQFSLFAPKPGRFPEEAPAAEHTLCQSCDMGLGAGGRMRQEIFADEHGIDTWIPDPVAQAEVRLLEAHAYAERFGVPVPSTPVDVRTYLRFGLPWFELVAPDRRDIGRSERLAGVEPVEQSWG